MKQTKRRTTRRSPLSTVTPRNTRRVTRQTLGIKSTSQQRARASVIRSKQRRGRIAHIEPVEYIRYIEGDERVHRIDDHADFAQHHTNLEGDRPLLPKDVSQRASRAEFWRQFVLVSGSLPSFAEVKMNICRHFAVPLDHLVHLEYNRGAERTDLNETALDGRIDERFRATEHSLNAWSYYVRDYYRAHLTGDALSLTRVVLTEG